jgi:hypothetical protein
LFTRAEIATMRDRTRRRNYSAEAEEFRREHARHREWGLAQRHARKLSRLYGSTANAAATFQRRVDELTSPPSSARAVAPTSSEPVGPEPPASAPALPEPIGPKTNRSEQAKPEQIEQAKPEQAGSEQAKPEQAVSDQTKTEQAGSDLINVAGTASFDLDDVKLSVKITWVIAREDGDWKIVSHHVSSKAPLI